MTRARENADGARLDAPLASPTFTGTVAIPNVANLETAVVANTAKDVTGVRQDITILALREAVTENRVASNLANSFIDQFQNSDNITLTDLTRNASEYLSITPAVTAVPFSTITRTGAPIHSTGSTKWTTDGQDTSISVDGMYSASDTGYLLVDHGATKMDFLTDATASQSWTVDYWINYQSEPSDWKWTFGWGDVQATNTNCLKFQAYTTTGVLYYGVKGGNITDHEDPTNANSVAGAFTNGQWYHMAFIRDGTNDYMYQDGVQQGTFNIGTGVHENFRYTGIAMWDPATTNGHDFYFDDFRISNSVRWPSGSSFTRPTTRAIKDSNTKFLLQSGSAYSNLDGDADDFVDSTAIVGSATGTVVSTTNVPSSARTKVSGVMLWKDGGSGTSTIGTHLKIYFTCIAGDSNWVETTYTEVTPVFSTGVKMVRFGETTCTSGSDIRYKAVWATQSDGVIETQLHGIGLNY